MLIAFTVIELIILYILTFNVVFNGQLRSFDAVLRTAQDYLQQQLGFTLSATEVSLCI